MSEYIKYFDDGRKNMTFKIEDDNVLVKYNKIWNKIKITLNTKSHNQSIYHAKYIKTKVKAFNDAINTIFSDNRILKERSHYTCIAAICTDSVMKKDKKNYSQVYLEQ